MPAVEVAHSPEERQFPGDKKAVSRWGRGTKKRRERTVRKKREREREKTGMLGKSKKKNRRDNFTLIYRNSYRFSDENGISIYKNIFIKKEN